MPIDLEADLNIFFADFGVDTTLTTSGPAVSTPVVLFFTGVTIVDPRTTEIDVDLDLPNILGKTTDFAAAKHKDTIIINGTTFIIQTVTPDGTGMSNIELYT